MPLPEDKIGRCFISPDGHPFSFLSPVWDGAHPFVLLASLRLNRVRASLLLMADAPDRGVMLFIHPSILSVHPWVVSLSTPG